MESVSEQGAGIAAGLDEPSGGRLRRALRYMHPSSVRARTTAVAVLFVGAVLFVWAASLVLVVGDSPEPNLDEAEIARMIAFGAERGDLPPTLEVPGTEDDDAFIQVVDARGRVVASSGNYLGQPPIADVRPSPGETWRTTLDGVPPVDLDDKFRLVGRHARMPSGAVTIFVGVEHERIEESVHTLSRALRLGAPGLLVLSAGLVWLLVGRALRPVESIRSQVAEITAHALDRRVLEPPVDDEIGRLARTMNTMLDRLERSAERQRRFVADASHELRSPLAMSRTQLEIAASHPEATEWPVMIADLLKDNQRMERMVSDLLFLASRDERPLDPTGTLVAVDDLLLDAATRLPHRVAVDTSAVSRAVVSGDPDDLARVIRNLLDNAERHARSAISLESRQSDGTIELVVADDGAGVPPEHREIVFDRFARLDEARSRDEGGSGLGLSIVRDIVSAHGGRVWVEEGARGGARFVVRLPGR